KTPVIQSLVARVFVSRSRHDELGKVVAHCLVGKGVPEVAGVSGAARVELACSVPRLVNAGQETGNQQRGVVEAILVGNLKLAGEREWRQPHVGTGGPVVWNDFQDASGLLAVGHSVRLGGIQQSLCLDVRYYGRRRRG